MNLLETHLVCQGQNYRSVTFWVEIYHNLVLALCIWVHIIQSFWIVVIQKLGWRIQLEADVRPLESNL